MGLGRDKKEEVQGQEADLGRRADSRPPPRSHCLGFIHSTRDSKWFRSLKSFWSLSAVLNNSKVRDKAVKCIQKQKCPLRPEGDFSWFWPLWLCVLYFPKPKNPLGACKHKFHHNALGNPIQWQSVFSLSAGPRWSWVQTNEGAAGPRGDKLIVLCMQSKLLDST